MELLLVSTHIISSVFLILLILIQQGKGAEAGATLGGGDNSALFGPMTENPLHKATTIIALIFMVTSVSLAYKARFPDTSDSQMFFKDSTSNGIISPDGKSASGESVLDSLGLDSSGINESTTPSKINDTLDTDTSLKTNSSIPLDESNNKESAKID